MYKKKNRTCHIRGGVISTILTLKRQPRLMNQNPSYPFGLLKLCRKKIPPIQAARAAVLVVLPPAVPGLPPASKGFRCLTDGIPAKTLGSCTCFCKKKNGKLLIASKSYEKSPVLFVGFSM